ncbi:hypothetical protein SADUNF_Sadunf18G0024700 [Salix dunnii]|uniref:Uncharacterized protein n=1 Tax=Salix dunnii TaxID=1413687 RepID=A0A835J3V5_9ROSI|nr:hypothetical protein SADUNF_Sadunf18G0024700 [Salix dunnii]
MGTAIAQYPYGITSLFHVKFDHRLEISSSSFHYNLEISRFNLYPSSVSTTNSKVYDKDCLYRLYAQLISPFFQERSETKTLLNILLVMNFLHFPDMFPTIDISASLPVKDWSMQELKLIASEIRSKLSSIMSNTKKDFKASLAAVELTVAIHHVFHAPVDKILWDAGEQVRFAADSALYGGLHSHQRADNSMLNGVCSFVCAVQPYTGAASMTIDLYFFRMGMDWEFFLVSYQQTYAHKILTGRRSLMHTLRQKDGLSGFTSRSESECDLFGAGHRCNSISAGLGMAVARDIQGKQECTAAVIGNGTTMAGQVYEAMGNAGYLDSNMIVILNDSRHYLHPKIEECAKTSINALSSTLSKLQSSKSFWRLREVAKGVTKRIGIYELAAKVEYLVCVLQEVSILESMGPVLIHVITEENQCAEHKRQTEAMENQQDGMLNSYT